MNMKNSKAEIFAALEAALAELALRPVTQPVVAKVIEPSQPIVRDKTIFIAAAQKQRAEFAAARTEFVMSWCAANAQTSCPSNVVAEWASARK